MNTQTLNGFEQMTKVTFNKLTEEVKETEAKVSNGKVFSSVDLWNIQKSKKSINARRSMAL